jgi:hypothetical protein
MPQPPTWRARVSLLVWPIAFDPSGMGGPTGNICYRRHGSQVHLGTQAPPLRQSGDTSRGSVLGPENYPNQHALAVDLFHTVPLPPDSEGNLENNENRFRVRKFHTRN